MCLGVLVVDQEDDPAGAERVRLPGVFVGDPVDNGPGFVAVDPLGDPDGARHALVDLADAGTTIANLTFRTRSPEHYCEQLAAMKDLTT